MPTIHLETVIRAPRERVFDLARSIDAHRNTAAHTGERAVAGVTSGLLNENEEVTWEARHFGVKQRLRVKMVRLDRPRYFQDCMLEGAFREMSHEHAFEARGDTTLMVDRFAFRSPLGILGWLADRLIIERYMRRFLQRRNAIVKRTAESNEWKKYLKEPNQGKESERAAGSR
jgi:ligand-binding SRPBCC domain-containing protein